MYDFRWETTELLRKHGFEKEGLACAIWNNHRKNMAEDNHIASGSGGIIYLGSPESRFRSSFSNALRYVLDFGQTMFEMGDDRLNRIAVHILCVQDTGLSDNNEVMGRAEKVMGGMSGDELCAVLSDVLEHLALEKKLFGRRQNPVNKKLMNALLLGLPAPAQRLALKNSAFGSLEASKSVRQNLALNKAIASQDKKKPKKRGTVITDQRRIKTHKM